MVRVSSVFLTRVNSAIAQIKPSAHSKDTVSAKFPRHCNSYNVPREIIKPRRKQRGAHPRQCFMLCVHHPYSAAQHAIQNVVKVSPLIYKLIGSHSKPSIFCGTVFGLAIMPITTISTSNIFPPTFSPESAVKPDKSPQSRRKTTSGKTLALQQVFSANSILMEVNSAM